MSLFERIAYHGRVAFYMMKLELQGQMEYPSFLIGWLISNLAQFFVGVATLKVITSQFGDINGWSYEQIIFIYGIGILSHGLAVVFFIQTWYIDGLVRYGGFDRMLLRPMSIFFQFSFEKLNLIGLTDLIPGIMIFSYGCILLSFNWSAVNVMLFLITVVGATFIRGGIYTLVGSVGFWTKNKGDVIGLVNTMFFNTIMYPINIYSNAIQAVFTFIFPLGFLAFYPGASFLGAQTEFNIPGHGAFWTLIVGIIIFVAGRLVFACGIKHYDSSGS